MHLILLFPLLINLVFGSIQFTIASGECPYSGNGGFNPCDDSDAGGLCASASDLDRTWRCRLPNAFCGSWGQTCTGTGNLAGKGHFNSATRLMSLD